MNLKFLDQAVYLILQIISIKSKIDILKYMIVKWKNIYISSNTIPSIDFIYTNC